MVECGLEVGDFERIGANYLCSKRGLCHCCGKLIGAHARGSKSRPLSLEVFPDVLVALIVDYVGFVDVDSLRNLTKKKSQDLENQLIDYVLKHLQSISKQGLSTCYLYFSSLTDQYEMQSPCLSICGSKGTQLERKLATFATANTDVVKALGTNLRERGIKVKYEGRGFFEYNKGPKAFGLLFPDGSSAGVSVALRCSWSK